LKDQLLLDKQQAKGLHFSFFNELIMLRVVVGFFLLFKIIQY